MKTADRRQQLKDALVSAAERAIEAGGLSGVKARPLAAEGGCAVGAIYNAVADLDDLILAVNSRTLAALEGELNAAGSTGKAKRPPGPIDRLVSMGLAYLRFAASHTLRWRALFEHRAPPGKGLPQWYLEDQMRLFAYVEEALRELQPRYSAERRALLARSLFSAVHGVVMLGLEEKLQAIPPEVLREQVTFIVTSICRSMQPSR